MGSIRLQIVSTLKLLAADDLHMYPIACPIPSPISSWCWEVNANMTALAQL